MVRRQGDLEVRVVERDGSRVDTLPNAYVENMSWKLNGGGTATINLPALDSRGIKAKLVKREIQIWHNDFSDAPLWWGVPWRRKFTSQQTTLTCDDLFSYFARRFITYTSLVYTSLDQHTIAWNLISHAQTTNDATDYRNLHISAAAFAASGRVRSREYPREEHGQILEYLNEFSGLDDGFDQDIVFFGDGRREWTPYYPSKGQRRPDVRLKWGQNVVDYDVDEDAVNMANLAYVTGGSNGDVRFEANYRDDDAAEEYGQMEAVISEGSQQDVEWLDDKAVEEVNRRKVPIYLPQLTIIEQPHKIIGNLATGDIVPVDVVHGDLELQRELRIVGMTWNADRKIAMDFNELVA